MKIILSPAKKMNINLDTLEPMGLPIINVNLKMYSFDHLRMYNIDHINTCCSRR